MGAKDTRRSGSLVAKRGLAGWLGANGSPDRGLRSLAKSRSPLRRAPAGLRSGWLYFAPPSPRPAPIAQS